MADSQKDGLRQRRKVPSPGITVGGESRVKQSSHLRAPESYEINPFIVFVILCASHTIAVLYQPINDCDEVFNYWEPTHYLNYGNGFQTWEYSPTYAIRSWTYAGLHALILQPAKILSVGTSDKAVPFWVLRTVLALTCAGCETVLLTKIAAVLNARVAITFMIVMATSPGMFHASIAYLPSSFSMYGVMLGMAAFMDWRGGLRTVQGIFAMGTGAVLGWPFAAAMAIPYILEEVSLASISDRQAIVDLAWRLVDGVAAVLAVLAVQIGIDAFFFRKFAIVPFNIVWYNVFSGSGGPDLYGTEPWHFYIRNLFLNFHLWFLLALFTLPVLLVQRLLSATSSKQPSSLRGIVFASPFYLWLAIFTLQPHKEERFMYPAYPALALNAAMTLHVVLAQLGSTDPKKLISKIPLQLRFLTILVFVFICLGLSAFRTLGTMTGYGAPLSIYEPLGKAGAVQHGDNVCLGKEWYRFPSHFHLPRGVHAKFIRSEFSGLLPGEFHESTASNVSNFRGGTYLIPAGMNDQNREDASKYTDIKHCNFLVDTHMPSTGVSKLEPNYLADTDHWEKVKCLPFLDAASSGGIGRLGWVPNVPMLPAQLRRVYGEYCLLRRKKKPIVDGRADPVPHIETLS